MKRGFTLIELLAVIVILAIIALIATPIILGIINDARNSAKERSAELVYTGVEYAYTTSLYKNTEGTVLADPTLTDLKNNLQVDNVTSANVEGEGDTEKLVIVTNDNVTCNVTKVATGFNVECGKYFEGKVIKTLATN